MITVKEAIEILNRKYHEHVWDENPEGETPDEQMTTKWPGRQGEDIVISVHKDAGIFQKFHRHDFFFINYAWQGDFYALSKESDRKILIHQGEAYMAQPHSGYAVVADPDQPNIIVAILIQRNAFIKEYFSLLARNQDLFDFFLTPNKNRESDQCLLLSFDPSDGIKELVSFMMREYACPGYQSQDLLKSLVLSFLLCIARKIKDEEKQEKKSALMQQVLEDISASAGSLSLNQLAEKYGYHPAYLSSKIKFETGETFSELVNRYRMEHALILLQNTTLPVEEIAFMLGYSNAANFYRSFKEYYQQSPRAFIQSFKLSVADESCPNSKDSK